MKNKKMVLPLILIVIGVWGAIFYQFFIELAPSKESKSVEIPINVASKSDAKITLMLNYPSPFNLERVRRKMVVSKLKDVKATQFNYAPHFDFTYQGMVEYNNKRIALINKMGHLERLVQGDSIDKYKIIQIESDSIVINNKHTYIIKRD